MARIVGGFAISHTPSMGLEYDRGMRGEWNPRWKTWFDGTRPMRDWLTKMRPDRLVIVYNDHLNHFSFEAYPTIAIGVASEFRQADEGWGLRPFPSLRGDVELGWHLTNRLVRGGYDLTVCQDLAIDHGIYSWLPYLMDPPWDGLPITPIAINMVRHPIPTSQRLHAMGHALRDALADFPGDERILVVATGGMSHQISGARFGIANETLDRWFIRQLKDNVGTLVNLPQEELMRLGGTEAAELAIWFAMRGALSADLREGYSFYCYPANCGCGIVAYEEPV